MTTIHADETQMMVDVTPEDLKAALQSIVKVASKKKDETHLSLVRFEAQDAGELTISAANSRMLARVTVPTEAVIHPGGFAISIRAARSWTSWIRTKFEEDETVPLIQVTSNGVAASLMETTGDPDNDHMIQDTAIEIPDAAPDVVRLVDKITPADLDHADTTTMSPTEIALAAVAGKHMGSIRITRLSDSPRALIRCGAGRWKAIALTAEVGKDHDPATGDLTKEAADMAEEMNADVKVVTTKPPQGLL